MAEAIKKNAFILKKPSGAIAISGNLDIRERKFYNMFLKVAEETLKQDPQQHIFTTTLAELKQALNVKEEDKNNTNLKKILKRMSNVMLEYNILEKDDHIEGFAHLLDNVEFKTNKITNLTIVYYSIPEVVRLSMIRENGMYASINLIIVKQLQSKYSIVLYELVRDYQRVEVPKMTLENFKKLFGIEKKYNRIDHLKTRVLDVATKELNDNENVNFLVDYELIRTGFKYTHIKFIINSKPEKLKMLSQSEDLKKQIENKDLKEVLVLIPHQYRNIQKVVSIILAGLNSKGKEYTVAQVKYCTSQFEKNKVKNFIAFLKKALEEDYAGVEKIDLDVITPEDAVGYDGYATTKNGKTIHIKITGITKSSVDDAYIAYIVNVDTNETNGFKVSAEWLIDKANQKKEKEALQKTT